MNSSYVQVLLTEYTGKPMLLDSNLLLLLIVGSANAGLIESYKRLTMFSRADLHLLQNLSVSFQLSTCPHVLTEVSNLANGFSGLLRQTVFAYLASAFEAIEESYIPAREIVRRPGFGTFGLTDIALSEMCKENLLITHDDRFAAYLRAKTVSVLTLTDLRDLRAALRNH